MHTDAVRLVARWLPLECRAALLMVDGMTDAVRHAIIDAKPWDVGDDDQRWVERLAVPKHEWRWIMERVTRIRLTRWYVITGRIVHLKMIRYLAIHDATLRILELLTTMLWLRAVVIERFAWESPEQPGVVVRRLGVAVRLPGLEELDVPATMAPLIQAPDLTKLILRTPGYNNSVFAVPMTWSWIRHYPKVATVGITINIHGHSAVMLRLPPTVVDLMVRVAGDGLLRILSSANVDIHRCPGRRDSHHAVEVHQAASVRADPSASVWVAAGIPRKSRTTSEFYDLRDWVSSADVPSLFF